LSSSPKTCVVVSYWTGRSTKELAALLRQMKRVDAGAPFDLVVVCNGGDLAPLALPNEFDGLRPRVLNRENTGWNLGAWEYGWREAGAYDYYLFLQDDCFLKRAGWVADFEFRFENDPGIGLVGEEIMWDEMSWPVISTATERDLGRLAWPEDEPVHPLITYQELMKQRGIPPGEVGTHLQSLILCAPRKILEEVGGFPWIGTTYREAVACEIGVSRLIASKGYRIARVSNQSFQFIGHRQWTHWNVLRTRLWNKVRELAKKTGLRKPKRGPGKIVGRADPQADGLNPKG
jgi:hypothetical protein